MKAVETRTRSVVRHDQFVSASACQSDPYTGSVTQTLNERHAVIIYPFTHPCQCARFLRASTLFGSDNASKIFDIGGAVEYERPGHARLALTACRSTAATPRRRRYGVDAQVLTYGKKCGRVTATSHNYSGTAVVSKYTAIY